MFFKILLLWNNLFKFGMLYCLTYSQKIITIVNKTNLSRGKDMQRSWLMVLSLVMFGAVLMTGCAYLKVQRPLDTDYNQTELGTKEGRSASKSLLWLFAWGDGGIKAAAENGGINVIKYADQEYYLLLFGLYVRVSTVVYGD